MEKLKNFDIAEHLTSEEDIQLYLNEIIKENNVKMLLSALGDIARKRNISELSKDTGISREGLYKALSGSGNPSFATVMKVAQALNLQLTFTTSVVN
ncbi:addiction module antidote protein [Volucribacter amazonae]|uniref:Addiction module antitoxin n=1 Tax=Volucribacter amazonae TaxID=256731 RepID=A0A9X4SJW5_9PAST|nr:addiction module antidote protein [Volucribacter amazonae]MDG6894554.1 addiction module antitoxin [Volucribacter amazonae]